MSEARAEPSSPGGTAARAGAQDRAHARAAVQPRRSRASTRALWLLAGLIAYGSLYPFRFALPPSIPAALAGMRGPWWTSIGDVIGNVLLFAPVGVALVMRTRRGPRAAALQAAGLLAAVAFAALLQLAQVFVPSRSAAWGDVWWNGVGTLLGIAAGRFAVAHLRRWTPAGDRLAPYALAGLAFWFIWRLWPFVPTLDWQHVKDSLKPLLLSPAFEPWSFAGMAATVPLLAGLVASWRHPRTMLVAMATAALAARPFLVGQVLSVGAVTGALAGLGLGLAALRIGIARAAPALVALAMAWYSAAALRPGRFAAHAGELHWLPFEAMLEGAMDINLAVFGQTAFLAGALMLLGLRARWRPGAWCALLAAWMVTLELVQLWLPARTSDLTVALFPLAWWLALRRLERHT